MPVELPGVVCPHRDDAPCSVCLELAAAKAEIETLRREVRLLERELDRTGRLPL